MFKQKRIILEKRKKSILELAGSLNLKGKEPSTRSEIYEKYLKDKIRR
jgi:hypothetical protein